MAGARGVSAPDLIGLLVDRAEDEELFASHATAYETLRTDHPDLLREIEADDGVWERADLRRRSTTCDNTPRAMRRVACAT
jgi:hypothetical protein